MIIKNCPSCHKDFRLNCQGQAYVNKYQCVYGVLDCEDVTNCLLKQIVKECQEVQNKVNGKYTSPSKAKFGRKILDLLEIEE